jgi:hypothetical protein
MVLNELNMLLKIYPIKFIYIFTLVLVVLASSCKPDTFRLDYSNKLIKEKEYKLILLCGQSNMVGLGEIEQLSSAKLPENIVYFNFGTNTKLKILNNTFGPEVGISKALHKKFPDQDFIIIKFAVGGSSIIDWSPINNQTKAEVNRKRQFNGLYNELLLKVKDITDGYQTELIAFLWMQGEEDSAYLGLGKDYKRNFVNLINSIRQDFNTNRLPVIFGDINLPVQKFPGVNHVKNAQYSIPQEIDNTYLIKTSDLEKDDDQVHFSSNGLLTLGERFGNVLIDSTLNR